MKAKPDRDPWRSAWRDALAAMSLGWDLAVPIFGGTLLGHFLDRWLHTGYIFTMGLLTLGVGTGFYNVMRTIRRVIERDQQLAEQEKREKEQGEDETDQ
ncbi:MAG: AtpZ/AtpI family protein [Anaerolineae bacterium]|nr:AtpZ/AtpI family protein [Anaerolineae bacterium]